MLTVIAKLKVKTDKTDTFEAEARKMIAHVRENEPGTLTYVLNKSTAEAGLYLFYEVYQDQGAFAVHGGSTAMQAFFAAMPGLLDGRPELTMYETVAAK